MRIIFCGGDFAGSALPPPTVYGDKSLLSTRRRVPRDGSRVTWRGALSTEASMRLIFGRGGFTLFSAYNSPQAVMMTGLLGVPSGEPRASTALTTSMPSVTSPKTACLPSSHCVSTVVTKNCEPCVSGPELAIESSPGLVCLMEKSSSANLPP